MSLQKQPKFVSKTLLRLAREFPCQFCGSDDKTVVAAHYSGMWSNKVGKGLGKKPDDTAIAYLCHDCHALIDGRLSEANFGAAEKHALFAVAMANTYKTLIESGYLTINKHCLDMTQDCV